MGNCRRAAGDEVGRNARRAVRHGPPDMAVAAIEDEVLEPPPADERQIGRRHRPKARPHLRPVVLGAVGKELLRHPLHEREVGGFMARVVAGEFGRRGDAQAVAEARNGDEVMLVETGDRRRRLRGADRNGQRVALDRIDGQAEAKLAGENGALGAERQHIGVAGERPAVGQGLRHPVAVACELARRSRR